MSSDIRKNGGRSCPDSGNLSAQLADLAYLDAASLRTEWRRLYRSHPPKRIGRDLLARAVAHRLQARALRGLSAATRRKVRLLAEQLDKGDGKAFDPGISLKPGAKLLREWGGDTHVVIALKEGFEFEGRRYHSLSRIAREITGAHWSGPRFFGLQRGPKPFAEPAVEGRP